MGIGRDKRVDGRVKGKMRVRGRLRVRGTGRVKVSIYIEREGTGIGPSLM